MMARVRAFHSPDVDLPTYSPADPGNVGVLVQILAGPSDGPGEESFDVVVCTPRWIEESLLDSGPLIGRHYLLVKRWDWAEVHEFLTRVVEREQAESWTDLASRIGRTGKWEFEDYQP